MAMLPYTSLFLWFPQPNKSPEKGKCSIGTLAPEVMAQTAGVSNSSNTVNTGSETTFESSECFLSHTHGFIPLDVVSDFDVFFQL